MGNFDPAKLLHERIRSEGVRTTRGKSEFLSKVGELSSEIYLMDEGVVGVTSRCNGGMRHILAFLMAPSIIIPAVRFNGKARYSIRCLSDSSFFAISRNSLSRIMDSDLLFWAAIEEEYGNYLDRIHDNLSNVLCRHGTARVAYLLSSLHRSSRASEDQSDGEVRSLRPLDITQVDMAAALGMTPVYLNKILKELKENRVIKLKSGKVQIRDLQALNMMF